MRLGRSVIELDQRLDVVGFKELQPLLYLRLAGGLERKHNRSLAVFVALAPFQQVFGLSDVVEYAVPLRVPGVGESETITHFVKRAIQHFFEQRAADHGVASVGISRMDVNRYCTR